MKCWDKHHNLKTGWYKLECHGSIFVAHDGGGAGFKRMDSNALVSQDANGGSPFGVQFQQSIDLLDAIQELPEYKFMINPPKPHPLFSQYLVQATPRLGVVWIKGISEPIDSDDFGIQTRTLVDRIADQLSKRYGTGLKTDTLLHGSIWDEPQYWMTGLSHHERMYSYMWNNKGRAKAPVGYESIFVGAVSAGNQSSTVHIEYASSKMSLAEAEVEDGMAELL